MYVGGKGLLEEVLKEIRIIKETIIRWRRSQKSVRYIHKLHTARSMVTGTGCKCGKDGKDGKDG